MSKIDDYVGTLKGVGPKKEKLLEKIGLKTIKDMVFYFPKSYENRTKIEKIYDKENGEKINTIVDLLEYPVTRRISRNKSITKIVATDGDTKINLIWFNQPYIGNIIGKGEKIKIRGTVKKNGSNFELSNIVYTKDLESKDKIGSIIPIYPLTEGLKNSELINFMKESLNYLDETLESTPVYIKEELDLYDISKSIKLIHFPTNKEEFIKARNTLIINELLILQMGLYLLKNRRTLKSDYIEFKDTNKIAEFEKLLPFKLTKGQKTVIEEIIGDMESSMQMNRLVQGDVGSGKTIVAATAMIKAVESGYQSALMVPTEILANQHYENLKEYFNKLGITVGLLTSKLKASEKNEIIENLADGKIQVIVGTHAIIEDNIVFQNIGLVITDEQHRFGVNQRAKISGKGNSPDILVMTATPIPRTLSLILYGDLDISIIDTLPVGRKPIKTYVLDEYKKEKMYKFIQDQLKMNHQVYIVCPLIEESDILKLNSVELVFETIREKLPLAKTAIITGKQKSDERDKNMEDFKEHNIDILIATTVIEVGVDVPNANTIVIENAERFGLSQLHQLRGRVGRGSVQSYCLLINEGKGLIAKERCSILSKSTDGFYIAEKDLELRGSGEFFGFKQHGIPELNMVKLPRDIEKLKIVQDIAKKILKEDPKLSDSKNESLKNEIEGSIYSKLEISFN